MHSGIRNADFTSNWYNLRSSCAASAHIVLMLVNLLGWSAMKSLKMCSHFGMGHHISISPCTGSRYPRNQFWLCTKHVVHHLSTLRKLFCFTHLKRATIKTILDHDLFSWLPLLSVRSFSLVGMVQGAGLTSDMAISSSSHNVSVISAPSLFTFLPQMLCLSASFFFHTL